MLVLRIEKTKLVMRLAGVERPVELRIRAPSADDLQLIAHMCACLRDGGRDKRREHPSGKEWFEFLGRLLWERLHVDVAAELRPDPEVYKRVLLEIDEDVDPVLRDAPWELLRYSAGRGDLEPFGTSPKLAVSRLVESGKAPEAPSAGTELRVLLIEAADGSLGANVETYLRSRPGISLTSWTPQQVMACVDGLRGRPRVPELVDAKFDIIQVLAHGSDDRGKVSIKLDSDCTLEADDVCRLVRDRCRSVILTSCSTAPLARSLLDEGVECVVAMLYDIKSSRIDELNRAFYEAVMAGDALDAALQKARNAIDQHGNLPCCGAPVLYVRHPAPIAFKLDLTRYLPAHATQTATPTMATTTTDALAATPAPARQVTRDADAGVPASGLFEFMTATGAGK